MKSNDALDARISALENLVSVLILSRVAEWENPSDEMNRIFSIAYEIGMQRVDGSQPGPELAAAGKAFTAIDRMFELMTRFIDELERRTRLHATIQMA
ncbi:MAG: hypothetical protein CME84_02720 [Henriciella sp.]|jgi:hypothetical protein|uniref:hypothetical protein n=1 Tax=uncultured Henriciella sp. TaxID=1608424 RepID=UPI000C595A32|nr:hypothetical protein [Henriciella sp.]MBF34660.1 hypothetical protein [Hyphomonadaceae bacterium]|tara:strand:+ start:1883 stop:2176 length:294 start_codon:yes stop_codon:yes gene_type:complete